MSSKNRAPEHTKGVIIFSVFWCTLTIIFFMFTLLFFMDGINWASLFFPPFSFLFAYVGIRNITFNIKKGDLFYNVYSNPSEETAREYLEYYKKRRPKLCSVANHPKYWNTVRERWYRINGSNKIPTELKKEILTTLKKDGLFVKDTIVNNYNK